MSTELNDREPMLDLSRAFHGVGGFCYWCQSILSDPCDEQKAKTCPNGSWEKHMGIELPKERL